MYLQVMINKGLKKDILMEASDICRDENEKNYVFDTILEVISVASQLNHMEVEDLGKLKFTILDPMSDILKLCLLPEEGLITRRCYVTVLLMHC